MNAKYRRFQEEQALTQEWQTVTTSLNVPLQPQDDIARGWPLRKSTNNSFIS